MKGRYWVFAWVEYEPVGGVGDLVGMCDTMQESQLMFNQAAENFGVRSEGHCFDTSVMEVETCYESDG